MNTGQKYAIIVGVTDYEDDQISQLKYTKNDALRLASILIQYCGFEKQHIHLLVNDIQENPEGLSVAEPTRANLIQQTTHCAKKAKENDHIIFYFAGHGAEVSKNPYLLTSDTRMDVLQDTALNVGKLNDILEASEASCIIRMFDACRSPFGEARGFADGRMTDGLQNAIMKSVKGWASFSSCSSGETAHESGEFNQGIFSYYLCEGLAGKATNENSEVTFDRIVDYVKTSVSNWSDKQSRLQTPHIQSDLSGVLVLARSISIQLPQVNDKSNPLHMLASGIDTHLLRMPEDARNLCFTDASDLEDVFASMQTSCQILAQDFEHLSLTICIGTPQDMSPRINHVWSAFQRDASEASVGNELQQAKAIQIEFASKVVTVPSTVLTIAVARFSFFYWIWYHHRCPNEQLQGSFRANPREKTSYFTFAPKAGRSEAKIDDAVRELFKQAGEDILDWSEQLGEYVNGRLTPLREMGPIIE